MIITSVENNKIKELSKLSKKKYRDLTNTYLVEGEHLVIEASKANVLKEILVLDGFDFDFNCDKCYVSLDVMKKLSSMDTPCNIIGVCNKNCNNEIIGNHILLLDSLQDPGNLGTIIRSSLAFNIDTIILSENTVDLYNSKVLRATQGMYNHINIISMDCKEAILELKRRGITVFGTNVNNGVDVRELSNNEKDNYCLIMGNEGNGVREEIQEMCDRNLYINMNSKVESLNVAIACSILLYELGR